MNCQNFEHRITREFSTIIHSICRDKAAFRCDETLTDRLFIDIRIPMDDLRIVKGTSGKCILSIKRLVVRAGKAQGIPAGIEIDHDHSTSGSLYHQYVRDPDFNIHAFVKLLGSFLDLIGLNAPIEECKLDEKLKLRVIIPTTKLEDRDTIVDINNLFYPYGFSNGQKIDIKTCLPSET